MGDWVLVVCEGLFLDNLREGKLGGGMYGWGFSAVVLLTAGRMKEASKQARGTHMHGSGHIGWHRWDRKTGCKSLPKSGRMYYRRYKSNDGVRFVIHSNVLPNHATTMLPCKCRMGISQRPLISHSPTLAHPHTYRKSDSDQR